MIIESILICPECHYKEAHLLEANIVPVSFRCKGCHQSIKINAGECCIYCRFGDCPCLQTQVEGASCCAGQ